MCFSDMTIGFGITGSYCTFSRIKPVVKGLTEMGANVVPIFSYNASKTDTRFTTSEDMKNEIKEITSNDIIYEITDAEPIGPKKLLDVMVIAPCTGNTIAKLAWGITDTPVLMAAKAHLRNNRPLVIAISTNDALGVNFQNIGKLMAMKNIYFVPFGQDDYKKKPNSMVACFEKLPETIIDAMLGKQVQPVIL